MIVVASDHALLFAADGSDHDALRLLAVDVDASERRTEIAKDVSAEGTGKAYSFIFLRGICYAFKQYCCLATEKRRRIMTATRVIQSTHFCFLHSLPWSKHGVFHYYCRNTACR